MKKFLVGSAVVAVFALSGCSSFDGQMGKEVHEFTDKHGRICTSVKWGQSASVDCDWPQEGN